MNIATEQEQTQLTLGEQLRQAREAQNLSFEQVSEQINLRPSVLQHIENNEFSQKFIPPAFMKGYVRNYAKFLRLPEHIWLPALEVIDADMQVDLNKSSKVKKVTNKHSHNHRWIGCLTIIILIILFGLTALWWWENHQKTTAERETLVQNYMTTNEKNNNDTNKLAVDIPVQNQHSTVASEVSEVEMAKTSVNEQKDQQNPKQENLVNNLVVDLKSNEQSVENKNNVATNSANSAQENIEKTNSNHLNDDVSAVENSAVLNSNLVIEITNASCWLSVKDSKGKVLAEKEYKKGEILTFNQSAYSLIIGKTC